MSREPTRDWPQCEYDYHHSHGRMQCLHPAMFVVIDLTDMGITLSCATHLADLIFRESEANYEPQGGEHPMLIRLLHEGGIGWPTSSA